MNEKKNLSPPSPLNGRKKWRNWAKIWELIIHRCIGQSCLNLVCEVLRVEGVCSTKTIQAQQGSTELRMRENRVLVLPVNILTVWHTGFTWPHDTLPCVLIIVHHVIKYCESLCYIILLIVDQMYSVGYFHIFPTYYKRTVIL